MGKRKTKSSSSSESTSNSNVNETSSSSTLSNSNTTERGSVTPTNPLWVTEGVQGLGSRLSQLGQMDPYGLVAPLNGLEQQAMSGAGRLDGYGFAYDEAADWTRGVAAQPAPTVQAASLLDGIEAYYNPYRSQVVDAATADFDADAGRTRASQALSLAGASAFGGSGAALTQAFTESELARARNTQLSSLLAGMFNSSAALAGQDADRRQQASSQNAQLAAQHAALRLQAANGLAGLAGARATSDREDVATQAALGAQARGVDQAYRMAPYTALTSQADIMAKLPLELFRGSSSEGSSSSNSSSNTHGASSSVSTTQSNSRSQGTNTETPSFLDSLAQAANIFATIKGAGK